MNASRTGQGVSGGTALAPIRSQGCTYARLSDHSASLVQADNVVRLKPSGSELRCNEAIAMSFRGRVAKAEEAVQALIRPLFLRMGMVFK
jgi:Flp pilus assembly protein TadD